MSQHPQQNQAEQKKNNKKKPYQAPKATRLGSVQEMTQLAKGGGCGSQISFVYAG